MKFLPMLAIAFIVLKLCSVISWSWWLVLLPIYGPMAFVLGIWICGILGLAGVVAGGSFVAKVIDLLKNKKSK